MLSLFTRTSVENGDTTDLKFSVKNVNGFAETVGSDSSRIAVPLPTANINKQTGKTWKDHVQYGSHWTGKPEVDFETDAYVSSDGYDPNLFMSRSEIVVTYHNGAYSSSAAPTETAKINGLDVSKASTSGSFDTDNKKYGLLY